MKLVWLDLETTGLDPQRDRILEMYAARTDLERPFEIEWAVHRVVQYRGDPSTLEPYIRGMHEALLVECAASNESIDRVEDALLELVPEVESAEDRTTLAGRSVHFDLGFIRVHMPWLARRLHYRVLDVSGVEVFLRSMGMPRLVKAKAHRAQADVEESIRHAKACAEWIRDWKTREEAADGR